MLKKTPLAQHLEIISQIIQYSVFKLIFFLSTEQLLAGLFCGVHSPSEGSRGPSLGVGISAI